MSRWSLLWIVLLMGVGPDRKTQISPPVLPGDVRQIVEWLPPDSESLLVSNGPFPCPAEAGRGRPFLETVRPFPFGMLVFMQKKLLARHLAGQNILLAVEGCRHFRAPKGLGMMPYDGCQIVRFEPKSHEKVRQAFDACLQAAEKTIQVENQQVACFQERLEQDEWSLLLAHPRPGMLLCATDHEYLKQVLQRMQGPRPGRAFPDSLPEWEYLKGEAAVWGLRHYRREFSKTDPTSPFREKAAANLPDPGAVGLVFWFDPTRGQSAHTIYLTKSKQALQLVEGHWWHPEEQLSPKIKEIKPGVIEIVEPVNGDQQNWTMFLLMLLGGLGHAIYL